MLPFFKQWAFLHHANVTPHEVEEFPVSILILRFWVHKIQTFSLGRLSTKSRVVRLWTFIRPMRGHMSLRTSWDAHEHKVQYSHYRNRYAIQWYMIHTSFKVVTYLVPCTRTRKHYLSKIVTRPSHWREGEKSCIQVYGLNWSGHYIWKPLKWRTFIVPHHYQQDGTQQVFPHETYNGVWRAVLGPVKFPEIS